MKTKIILTLMFAYLLLGCDIFKGKERNIIGNISVINPDNVEDKGYKMVIFRDGFNANVLEEYIANVNGNDTVMLIESIDKNECSEHYYKINHNKGQQLLKIEALTNVSYSQLISAGKWSYSFSDDSYGCN